MKRTGLLLLILAGAFSCLREAPGDGDLRLLSYQPQPLALENPPAFVRMVIPADNPLTVEGVALGRRLFYDSILSADSSVSCATCHLPQLAFTDARAVSIGVDDVRGRRSSPSLPNVGDYYKGLFWDGRVGTLEEQAFHPVRDKTEMAMNWAEVENRLRNHPDYPVLFRRAFGIERTSQIDSVLAARALAQFQRTLVSSNAKFDRVKRGEAAFTAAEERGSHIFFDSSPALPVSECVHCHSDPLFTNLDFFNNGIMPPAEQRQTKDSGRVAVTGRLSDLHKFRTPTLRNIALTAPYMHDGRFSTLEEVIDHYASGGHFAHNVNPNVRVLNLTDENKADLIAFLHTLTDSTALLNPAFRRPVELLD